MGGTKHQERSRVETQLAEARLRIEILEATQVERRRVEDALRLNESRLQALLALNRMTSAPDNEITDFALEEAVRLTNSTIGYLAFLNEDESFSPCTPGRRRR